MAQNSLAELMIRDVLATHDIVERHIITFLQRLLHQNKRLKDHIQKTGAWTSLKDVNLWKPFDFYYYFCTKYQDRYSNEYRQSGNIVLTYQKIEEFRVSKQITKTDYKKFIDLAFSQYFNQINIPRIAHICSIRLYNHLMKSNGSLDTPEDYHVLDRGLLQEHEDFEKYVRKFNEA